VLTPDFVTLVIDRRVTAGGKPVDEVATKAVVVCDWGVVVYTGLARLPDRSTMDEWIVKVLTEAKVTTLEHAAVVLTQKATSMFGGLPYAASDRRHAFMAAGWIVYMFARRPVIFTISNALDSDYRWLRSAQSEFSARRRVAKDARKFHVVTIGANVSRKKYMGLKRTLARGFPRISTNTVLRLSAEMIREIARTDRTVGADAVGVYIPPPNPGPGWKMLWAGGPLRAAGGGITFVEFKTSSARDQTWRSPQYVCGDKSFKFSMGAIKAKPDSIG
jgi:hypothetical protein